MRYTPDMRYRELLKILAIYNPEYKEELDVFNENPNFDYDKWLDVVARNKKVEAHEEELREELRTQDI